MLTIEQVITAWNAQADDFNQWESLGLDEQIEFAQQLECERCAKISEIFSKRDDDMGAIIARAIRQEEFDPFKRLM